MMDAFNRTLTQIGILELIGVCILSFIILSVLGIDLIWIMLFPIVYVIFKTRNELSGLKSCAVNLFSVISFKTWLLLGISNYIFALGSGIILNEILPSMFNISGAMTVTAAGIAVIG